MDADFRRLAFGEVKVGTIGGDQISKNCVDLAIGEDRRGAGWGGDKAGGMPLSDQDSKNAFMWSGRPRG